MNHFELVSSSVWVSLDHILWHRVEFELILSRFGKIMSFLHIEWDLSIVSSFWCGYQKKVVRVIFLSKFLLLKTSSNWARGELKTLKKLYSMNVFQFRTQKSWSRVWVEYGSSVVWARFELECSQSDLVKALFFEGGHLTPP